MKTCRKNFSVKLIAVLVSSVVCVGVMSGTSFGKMLPKKGFVVLTDTKEVYTQDLTKNEAERLASENNGFVVCEDVEVKASSNDFLKDKNIKKIKLTKEEKKDLRNTWNIKAIKADKVKKDKKAEKVKIAIIDSGIDYTDDINLVDYVNYIPGEEELTPMFQDSTGHGTSIAGVIAAKDNDEGITGINENVEIYSAKVLDYNNVGQISRVVEAIYWAISKDVHIINMSFGTSVDSPALKKAVQDAYNHGILIVSAVGNNGNQEDNSVQYPAAYDEVLGVGAVDTDAKITEESAKGEQVELVAPGEQIMSTAAFSGVMTTSGTSMAAPHVVGVASLMWQRDLKKSNNFIRKLLNETANKYGDAKSYGNGLVDAKYAEKMYDKFEKEYVESNENTNLIEDNDSEILQFEGVDFVEGVWGSANGDHVEIVESALANQNYVFNLSENQIKALKYGATYPDVDFKGFKTTHPYWHGFYESRTEEINGVYTVLYENNYVEAAIYQLRVAQALKSNSNALAAAVSKPASMSANAYLNCHNDIDNIMDWEDIIEENKSWWNGEYKAYVIAGMAIHNISDVFAHSSYTKSGIWITHKIGADDIEYIPRRFYAAKKATATALGYFVSGIRPDFQIFTHNMTGSQGNCYYKYFSLKYFKKFLNQSCSNSHGVNAVDFLDGMYRDLINSANVA